MALKAILNSNLYRLMMLENKSNSLMGLLAMTMFADKKVLSQEIKAFVGGVKHLQSAHVLDTSLSEAEIIMWYELNKAELKAKVTGVGFEEWLYNRLKHFEPIDDKQAILSTMRDIADADQEVHISEKALVVLVANHWNMAA